MGRYSRNATSPLNNSTQTSSCNSLCYFFTIAKRISTVGWLGRNMMIVLLDDTSFIGQNDFFNEYTKDPVCGRFIGGFEIDIEPSRNGANDVYISIPSQMYLSNLDIYSGYTSLLEQVGTKRIMKYVHPYSKYVKNSNEHFLLHSSFIKYADAGEGPQHNCDMITIQSTYNQTETITPIPHSILLSSFLSLIRAYNSLYQQVQYSSYFYLIPNLTHYVQFLFVIIIVGCFILPLLLFAVYSLAPQYLYDILKYNNNPTNEPFVINNRKTNIEIETSYLSPFKLVIMTFFFGLLSFLCYDFLFHSQFFSSYSDIISIQQTFTEDDITWIEAIFLYSSQVIPLLILLLTAKFIPFDSLTQVQITISLSLLPNVLLGVVMIFINIPFALFYEFLLAATTLIPLASFWFKPKLIKGAVLLSLLTTPLGLSLLIQHFLGDFSLLLQVRFLAFVCLVFYAPFSFLRLFSLRSYHEILKQMEYDEIMKDLDEKKSTLSQVDKKD